MMDLNWKPIDAYEEKAETPVGTYTALSTIYSHYVVFFNGMEIARGDRGGMTMGKSAAQHHYRAQKTPPKAPTQELIDLTFEIAMVSAEKSDSFVDENGAYDREKHMEWVAKHLRACGFPTIPMGASWGVLKL